MTVPVLSRTERRRRRERRRAGALGLGIIFSSVAATVVVLLQGPVGAHAGTSHVRSPSPHHAAAAVGAR